MYKVWSGEKCELILKTESRPYALRVAAEWHNLYNSKTNDRAFTFVTLGCEHIAKYWGLRKWESQVN